MAAESSLPLTVGFQGGICEGNDGKVVLAAWGWECRAEFATVSVILLDGDAAAQLLSAAILLPSGPPAGSHGILQSCHPARSSTHRRGSLGRIRGVICSSSAGTG